VVGAEIFPFQNGEFHPYNLEKILCLGVSIRFVLAATIYPNLNLGDLTNKRIQKF